MLAKVMSAKHHTKVRFFLSSLIKTLFGLKVKRYMLHSGNRIKPTQTTREVSQPVRVFWQILKVKDDATFM